MSKSKKKLVAETTLEMKSGQHRSALMEVGMYNVHKNKVHKDKNAYDKKKERRWRYDD